MLNKCFNIKEQVELLVERLIKATTQRLESDFDLYYFRLLDLLDQARQLGQTSPELYLAIADFTWHQQKRFNYYQEALRLCSKDSSIKDQIHLAMGLSHFHYGQKGLARLHLERSKEIASQNGHLELEERAQKSLQTLALI